MKLRLVFILTTLALATLSFSQTQFTCYPVGGEETPPNSSTGWGVGRFILSADQDTLYYSLFWRIPNTYSASHIHPGAPGIQNPSVHTLANANLSGAHGAQAIDASNLALLLAGNLYVNVHSLTFPNGEIRAQILQLPLHPEDMIYTSVMSGANEVPPNASVGWGLGTYRLSLDQDTLYYSFMWRLQNAWNAAHFHVGFAGQIGANIHTLGAGGATGAHGAWAIDATNLVRLNIDSLYANAHSAGMWTLGEIRDQIHYNPPDPNMFLSTLDLDFPPTYVGDTEELMIQILNTGPGPLIGEFLFDERLLPVFEFIPGSFNVPPMSSTVIFVRFSPTFEHDFFGAVEVMSNDPDPAPTINLDGTGCQIPIELVALSLHSCAPIAISYSMPWDLNHPNLQLAIEYSSDNFANSMYIDEFGYSYNFPQWSTAGMWGTEGAGVILDLQPETEYQVRLHSMDCTGAQQIGPAATHTTPAQVPAVDVAELTILPSDEDQNDVVLRWNTVTVNADGDTLPNLGFEIYTGTTPDLIDELIGITTEPEFTYAADLDVRFFKVVPILEDFSLPQPFIAWPPDGATVSGNNQIVVKDPLYADQWETGEIYIDDILVVLDAFAGLPENTIPREVINFDTLSPGAHEISVEIHDQFGRTFTPAAINVNVVIDLPYVSFDADYDDNLKIFYCDTVNGLNMDTLVSGIWWQNTQGQEGYNETFEFKWEGPDSNVVVKPIPMWEPKYITENSPTFHRLPAEWMVVTPNPVGFRFPVIQVSCCCEMVEMSSAGTADGTYKGDAGRTLGPFVRCANGEYSVSYAFEVIVTFRYFIVEEGGTMCTWGQDVKRTSTTSYGTCEDGAFVPLDPPQDETSHKMEDGVPYPNSGDDFGNDHYGNRPGDTGMDNSELGKSKWYDRPVGKGSLPSDDLGTLAVRNVRDATFLAKAAPPCDVDGCCITWELHWDVTFCEDCTIIQTVPPQITNYISPASCPALAE